jgi:hypothetical protein
LLKTQVPCYPALIDVTFSTIAFNPEITETSWILSIRRSFLKITRSNLLWRDLPLYSSTEFAARTATPATRGKSGHTYLWAIGELLIMGTLIVQFLQLRG